MAALVFLPEDMMRQQSVLQAKKGGVPRGNTMQAPRCPFGGTMSLFEARAVRHLCPTNRITGPQGAWWLESCVRNAP